MIIDLRYAVRSLLHAKGFTLAAVLTLVLGLGVNIAVFTVVDRVLFKPLPYRDADRLVMVTPHDPATYASVVVVLAAALLAATWLPSRRAARTDPARVLRGE